MEKIKDVLIEIEKLSFHVDFTVLNIKEDSKTPLILGIPLMKASRMLVDIDTSQVKVRIKDHEV